jgi:hypothetical protein
MAYKPRSDPRRFNIGETVEISSSLHTRFSGMRGEIVKVEQSRHAVTLDRYIVRLSNPSVPDNQMFWDIELKKVDRADIRRESMPYEN